VVADQLVLLLWEYDVVAIFEASDDTTATAMVLAAISRDMPSSKTTKLLTVQEATEAMHKANSVSYQHHLKGR